MPRGESDGKAPVQRVLTSMEILPFRKINVA
jgi:hypothetical protein